MSSSSLNKKKGVLTAQVQIYNETIVMLIADKKCSA